VSGREAETIPQLRSAWARVGLTRLAVTGAGARVPRICVEAGRVTDVDTSFAAALVHGSE
jgi:hypothetical protein